MTMKTPECACLLPFWAWTKVAELQADAVGVGLLCIDAGARRAATWNAAHHEARD